MKLVFRQLLVYLEYLMIIAVFAHFAPQHFAANNGRVVKLLLVSPSAIVCLMWLASYAKIIKTPPLKLWIISIFWACVPQNIYLSNIVDRSALEEFLLFASIGLYVVSYQRVSRWLRTPFMVLVTVLTELVVLQHSFFQDGTRSPIKLIALAAALPIVGMVIDRAYERRETMRLRRVIISIAKEDPNGKDAK